MFDVGGGGGGDALPSPPPYMARIFLAYMYVHACTCVISILMFSDQKIIDRNTGISLKL